MVAVCSLCKCEKSHAFQLRAGISQFPQEMKRKIFTIHFSIFRNCATLAVLPFLSLHKYGIFNWYPIEFFHWKLLNFATIFLSISSYFSLGNFFAPWAGSSFLSYLFRIRKRCIWLLLSTRSFISINVAMNIEDCELHNWRQFSVTLSKKQVSIMWSKLSADRMLRPTL